MRLRGLVVVGFVVALVAGCSGSSGTGAPASAAPAGSQPQASAAVTEPAQNGAAAAGVDATNPGNPIASATSVVGLTDDPKARLKVDVLSLRRTGKLLVLTLQVTPTNTLSGTNALFNLLGSQFWEPKLIDAANLKEYSVVSGSSRLSSSVTGVRAASGQPMFLYAVFAAPPAGVSTLNLLFAGSFPTLDNIPIS